MNPVLLTNKSNCKVYCLSVWTDSCLKGSPYSLVTDILISLLLISRGSSKYRRIIFFYPSYMTFSSSAFLITWHLDWMKSSLRLFTLTMAPLWSFIQLELRRAMCIQYNYFRSYSPTTLPKCNRS